MGDVLLGSTQRANPRKEEAGGGGVRELFCSCGFPANFIFLQSACR